MEKKKKKFKDFFTKLGIILGGSALSFGIAFGLNAYETHQDNNADVPIVNVKNENGIRIKQNRISETNTYSLTATVSPVEAYVSTVSWSVAWSSTNSTSISDYITLTISDDTLTCTVKVLKAFTTQAVITCTSDMDTTKTATCSVDYVSRTFVNPTDCDYYLRVDADGMKTSMGSAYASRITSYLKAGSLTGGTITGIMGDITITSVRIQNIDVSAYVIGDLCETKTINDMVAYLIDQGVSLDTLASCYLSVSYSYKLQFNMFDLVGGTGEDIRTVSTISGNLSKNAYFDSTNFNVSSVNVSDSELIF